MKKTFLHVSGFLLAFAQFSTILFCAVNSLYFIEYLFPYRVTSGTFSIINISSIQLLLWIVILILHKKKLTSKHLFYGSNIQFLLLIALLLVRPYLFTPEIFAIAEWSLLIYFVVVGVLWFLHKIKEKRVA